MELRSLPPSLPERSQPSSVTPSINSQSPTVMEDKNGSAEKGHLAGVLHNPDGDYIYMASQFESLKRPAVSPRYIEGPFFMFPAPLQPIPEHPEGHRDVPLPVVKLENHATPFEML